MALRSREKTSKAAIQPVNSFFTAFLEQAEEPDIFGLCVGTECAQHFANSIKDFGHGLRARCVARTDIEILRRQGLLHLPAVGIAAEFRPRSFVGDSAYALCGVTHTISTQYVLESVADIPVAPVKCWDALICTSHAVHDALCAVLAATEDDLRVRIGANKFTRPIMPVIPLGVHAKRYTRSEADRARWRTDLGIADETIAVLFFGRLSVHAKASPFQLARATEAASKASGKSFAIIWCGYFHDDFQRRVFMETAQSMAPSVPFHYVDGRNTDARFSIWSAADIYCSLSDNIQESFGLTVIEAMAAGLPVLVSNWNGYRMAVEHGKNGIMIDTYLPRASLADAAYRYISGMDTYDLYIGAISQFCFVNESQTAHWLARLAANATLRGNLAAAAREAVETSFDWRVIIPRYADLWREQTKRINYARENLTGSSKTWSIYDPKNTFDSFPSHHLTADMHIERGPLFERWSDLVKLPGILIHASFVTREMHYKALEKIFANGGSRKIGEVLAPFADKDRATVLRTLHWLIKVGLLRQVH